MLSHWLPAWLTMYLAITAGGKFCNVWVLLSWTSWSSSNPIERFENSTDLYNSSFVLLVSTFSWILFQNVSFTSFKLRASLSRTHRAMMIAIRDIMICAMYISRCVSKTMLSTISLSIKVKLGSKCALQVVNADCARFTNFAINNETNDNWFLWLARWERIQQIRFERKLVSLSRTFNKLLCDMTKFEKDISEFNLFIISRCIFLSYRYHEKELDISSRNRF